MQNVKFRKRENGKNLVIRWERSKSEKDERTKQTGKIEGNGEQDENDETTSPPARVGHLEPLGRK